MLFELQALADTDKPNNETIDLSPVGRCYDIDGQIGLSSRITEYYGTPRVELLIVGPKRLVIFQNRDLARRLFIPDRDLDTLREYNAGISGGWGRRNTFVGEKYLFNYDDRNKGILIFIYSTEPISYTELPEGTNLLEYFTHRRALIQQH